jgi:hypothetical protein
MIRPKRFVIMGRITARQPRKTASRVAVQPGVVHQHVQAAVGLRDGGDRGFPALLRCHLQICEGAAVGEFGGERFRVRAVCTDPEPDFRLRILFEEIAADAGANAAVSAGDEDAAHARSFPLTGK